MKEVSEASKKYKTLQTEIGFQFKDIKSKLKKHAQAQKAEPGNWGMVGDLAGIKELLDQLNHRMDCVK